MFLKSFFEMEESSFRNEEEESVMLARRWDGQQNQEGRSFCCFRFQNNLWISKLWFQLV